MRDRFLSLQFCFLFNRKNASKWNRYPWGHIPWSWDNNLERGSKDGYVEDLKQGEYFLWMRVSVHVCQCSYMHLCNKNNTVMMMSICDFSLKRCIVAVLEVQLEQVQRPGEPLIILALTLNHLTCHLWFLSFTSHPASFSLFPPF